MTRINNTQRSAFARLLREKKKALEEAGVRGKVSFWKHMDFDQATSPVAQRLITQYDLVALKDAVKRAEDAYDAAFNAADAEVDAFNDELTANHQNLLAALVLAVRDVWASEDVESAKEIVERFIKN